MNLNGRVSNPGDLRTSVKVQKRAITADAGGFQVEAWTDVATVWADWVNVHGSEAWTVQSIQAAAAATVKIRYRSDVDRTCVLLKGSERWEIVSMDDVRERHEYLELKVQRMTAG